MRYQRLSQLFPSVVAFVHNKKLCRRAYFTADLQQIVRRCRLVKPVQKKTLTRKWFSGSAMYCQIICTNNNWFRWLHHCGFFSPRHGQSLEGTLKIFKLAPIVHVHSHPISGFLPIVTGCAHRSITRPGSGILNLAADWNSTPLKKKRFLKVAWRSWRKLAMNAGLPVL